MRTGPYDIAIVGGGINGCGIARDAAGRGLSVLLVEKDDLASGTSSASTKLVHGGLRYLEHYEFKLVRHSLSEREVLWAMAPHIIKPLRFVLPHHRGLRPAWLIRLGLFLYDHIGGRKRLPPARVLALRNDPAGTPLKAEFTRGFEYSDCWVDDARLVVLNAMDAAKRGADIRVRTELTAARRQTDDWELTLADRRTGETENARARILINAGGPWVSEVLANRAGLNGRSAVRLVKGSHIVVPRLFEHDRAYIFQNADNRIIFAIPYEQDFTLIGTTDVDFEGDPTDVKIDQGEITYLCAASSEYFATAVSKEDVVWTYSGVRPLYDDGDSSAQTATRDYVLELDGSEDKPALLSIFGGKITTFRHLAEEVLDKLEPHLPASGKPWTRGAGLPGGDFAFDGFDNLAAQLADEFPHVAKPLMYRLASAYGTCTRQVLKDTATPEDLGVLFGHDLYQCEVEYLVRFEWAIDVQDIVWRRSKLGLRLSMVEIDRLDRWLRENRQRLLSERA